MKQYHKIQTVFKRNPDTNYKTILDGEFSRPEFDYLKKNTWVFTEKVDGTNIRVMWSGESISFGGKSDNAQIPVPLMNYLNETFLVQKDKFIEVFGDESGVCLYGEGYGGKIQKAGATYGGQQRFVLFDVKIGDWWLQRIDVEDIGQRLEIDFVPIVGEGTLLDMVEIVKNGVVSKWGDFCCEGIVARPKTELIARNGQRLITKIKNKDF